MRIRSATLLISVLALSCGANDAPTNQIPPSETEARALAPNAPALVDSARLQRYRDALPAVAHKRLQEIFESPSTLWFDKDAMIPSYQDSVGDGSYTPIGARPNSRGRGIIVPAGRRLFDEDGQHWSFPFGHTAGMDETPNKFVINFMSLPDANGSYLPVVYETFDDNRALGGLGLHKWTWLFPVGTTMGEVIFLEDSAGDLYAIEVRMRRRYLSGWAVNAYRPFPTASHLVDAIKKARGDWMTRPNLVGVIDHLERADTLVAKTLRSPDFNNVFTQAGYEDVLPAIGDEALVKELLDSSTFVSAYGQSWKANGDQVAFAATTNEAFSVVGSSNDVGILEVRESSCVRCHEDAGRSINDFEPDAILYGDIWGEDRIFSFHPWDQSRYPEFNTDNRRVRPEFASSGVVVRYDPNLHPDTIYRAIP